MREEVPEFLAQAEKSIEAAELLLGNDMAGFAAARAYYAMFYTAGALLATRDFGTSKHSTTINKYGEFFAKTGLIDPRFHRVLIDAYQMRISADYEFGRPGADAVRTLIDNAVDFLAAAREFLERGETDGPT